VGDADVVVVGAGAMGAATAWWLARRGRDVVVFEQFGKGHSRGSSHGASRVFRLSYPRHEYVTLAAESLLLWRRLEEETGVDLLTTIGVVDHGDDSSLGDIEASLARCEVTCERLSPGAAHERWPGLTFDTTVLYQPDAGRLHADRAVAAFQGAAEVAGAVFHFDQPVESIEVVGDGVVVNSGSGSHRAAVAVVAAGAWAGAVVDGLVPLPPLTVTVEQPAHFRPFAGAGHDSWPAFIHYRPGGALAMYGLMSPGEGVKVGAHGAGRVVDPRDGPFEPDPGRVEELARYVTRWVPGVDPRPASVDTCLYTTTPTTDFVVDRAGQVVVVSACSGHGFKFAPAIGRLAADLVDGCAPHPLFALDRRR